MLTCEHHKRNPEIMKKNSPLKDLCPEKNLTNNNARKIVVKKLKSPGTPKCEIEKYHRPRIFQRA